jgi:hypothetical protein
MSICSIIREKKHCGGKIIQMLLGDERARRTQQQKIQNNLEYMHS